MEEKKELFGGEKTSITKFPDEHSQELKAPEGEAPGPEDTEDQKEKVPDPTIYGCSTCRQSAGGCWKCNPAKRIRYWEKKAAKAAALEAASDKDIGLVPEWQPPQEAEMVLAKDAEGMEDVMEPATAEGEYETMESAEANLLKLALSKA